MFQYKKGKLIWKFMTLKIGICILIDEVIQSWKKEHGKAHLADVDNWLTQLHILRCPSPVQWCYVTESDHCSECQLIQFRYVI